MKKLTVSLLALGFYMASIAQTQSSRVEYQKISRPALVNEVPFAAKTIENAIEETFKKMGYKGSSAKDFTVYKGVRMSSLGPDSYDIYFMVEKKSRRDKDNSTVTMMISKGYDAFVDESTDATVVSNGKDFLNNLRDIVSAYDLEQQIAAQMDEVKSAEKKANNLEEEGRDLEKKKRKLEEQIDKNEKDQKEQKNEIEKQKQILDVLIGKRKQ